MPGVPPIRLYTTKWCGFCVQAKALLDARGLAYEEVALDDDPGFRQRVYELGRQWTVPLVTIDGEPIGGYRELAHLDRTGALSERAAAWAGGSWHRGQNVVPRPPSTIRASGTPHRSHGSPARP